MRRKTTVASAVTTLAVLGAGLALSGPVRASEDECRVPMAEWRPREQLQEKLRAEGWQRIDRLEVDDGCYEAKGYDRDGWRVEAKYDPKTFELVKLERKRNRLRDPAAGPSSQGQDGQGRGDRGLGAGADPGGGAGGGRGK
jgi:hypothetical protein